MFGYFREQGYKLDRRYAAPDFVIADEPRVSVEACASNPSQDTDEEAQLPMSGWPAIPDDLAAEERQFVFQAGKALRRKLLKRDAEGRAYWELPHVARIPFVIALEAFHNISSLFQSAGSLGQYLYGRRDIVRFDAAGRLRPVVEPIGQHHYEGKSIPSGLFALPEGRRLAAVLFSNSSTVSVFNRLGTERGYGPPDIALLRVGTTWDPDPDATEPHLFGHLVSPVPAEERETFGEGLHVLHNPWAETPLPAGALRGTTEHQLLEDGRVMTTGTRLSPFVSQTLIFEGAGADAYAKLQLLRFLGLVDDGSSGDGPSVAAGQ